MEIRLAACEEDCYTASQIYAIGWKTGYKDFFSNEFLEAIAMDRWAPFFLQDLTTHQYEIAILSEQDKDLGAGGYGPSRDYDDPQWGKITSIYFLPEAWGKGYSKHLIDFMVASLHRKGFTKIHLWALQENHRAQKFYEKNGFTLSGKIKTKTIQGVEKLEVEYVR